MSHGCCCCHRSIDVYAHPETYLCDGWMSVCLHKSALSVPWSVGSLPTMILMCTVYGVLVVCRMVNHIQLDISSAGSGHNKPYCKTAVDNGAV